MVYQFKADNFSKIENTYKKEWSLTNGIGGYGGTSISGALTRTHHGYLIASLHPPVDRFLTLAKTDECILQDNKTFSFATNVFMDQAPHCQEGYQYLTSFTYDGCVSFTYETDCITLVKEIALVQNENTCAISYKVTNKGADAKLVITPFLNYRVHHNINEVASFSEIAESDGISFLPEANSDIAIRLRTSEGLWEKRGNEDLISPDLSLPIEIELETEGRDRHYTPYNIVVDIPANTSKDISLLCQIKELNTTQDSKEENINSLTSASLIKAQHDFCDKLLAKVNSKDPLVESLTIAANSFLSYRASTGLTTILAGLPWFTDWGRDTMIAFTGLTLATGRFDKAKEILSTFSKYVSKGLVPNMFPDDNLKPLYNTVDASLWYFYAVYKYLSYDKSKEAKDFVKKEIYPCLVEIQNAYEAGTDFDIYMDTDGLIHAGSDVDQITWMDVRVGDWVPTPRHGKPVEINALWYNALCIMVEFTKEFAPEKESYIKHLIEVKTRTKTSFQEKFWNEKENCLYDVLGDKKEQECVRPNQIYAVALPFSILSEEKEIAVVRAVKERLFVGVGLRSLSVDNDMYQPIYCGALEKRDAAYHQGTAWGFLLGGFFTAYMKVHHYSKEAAKEANRMLDPIRTHLYDNGIGTISEIFDGNAPHNGRGCYAQAWSVGEVLRAYTEDILPYI